MKRVIPTAIRDTHAELGAWNPDHNPDMATEEQTRWVLERTADNPESRRHWINSLLDLLTDEQLEDDDKHDFIAEAINLNIATPEESVAWLEERVDELLSDRPVERTTLSDGQPPTLRSIYSVRSVLNGLKGRVDGYATPSEAARVLVGWLGDRARTYAENLLALMNSDHADRDKADFIVEAAGPHFYSDLEAIEWAAAVARDVLDRLSEHHG